MSIYIIRHKESDNCYIGSCEYMRLRINRHKETCSNENSMGYNYKVYQFVRENGGWDYFDIVEICKCDIDKLRETEQYHMDFVKPSLNTINAYVSEEDRRQQMRDCKKLYHKKNQDKNNEKSREYYHKNNEKLKENAKKYREKNKDKLKEWNCVVECECGKTYTKGHKTRHFKSQYHLSHLPRPHSPRQT
jgi:hypothetical protein